MKLASSNALMRSTGYKSDPNQPNYEALVQFDTSIEHIQRDNGAPDFPWDNQRVITDKCRFPPPIVERANQGDVVRRTFDALVVDEDGTCWHWLCFDGVRDNWTRGVAVCRGVTGTPCLVTGQNRNESFDYFNDLHAFIQVGQDVLYFRLELREKDVRDARATYLNYQWQLAGIVTRQATGAPAAIITGDADDGSFEVLVPEGRELAHYYMPIMDFSAWGVGPLGVSAFGKRGVVAGGCDGPATIVELRSQHMHNVLQKLKAFGSPINGKPDFHALVMESGELVHYHCSNLFTATYAWSKGQVVTRDHSGPASMMETTYGQEGREFNYYDPEIDGNEHLFDKIKWELTKNGNLDVLLTIGDDLYFCYCELPSLFEYKWSKPVKIF